MIMSELLVLEWNTCNHVMVKQKIIIKNRNIIKYKQSLETVFLCLDYWY